MTPEVRLLAETTRWDPDHCWVWRGTRAGNGYPVAYSPRDKTTTWAHRLSYELFVGPIPRGLTIDHLCRNKVCVNPKHLEAVTIRENILRGHGLAAMNARKTHCPKGHPYDIGNTYLTKAGTRQCRKCVRARVAKNRPRLRAQKRGAEPPRHGTNYAYGVYACRCAECVRANTEAHRRYMQRKLRRSL